MCCRDDDGLKMSKNKTSEFLMDSTVLDALRDGIKVGGEHCGRAGDGRVHRPHVPLPGVVELADARRRIVLHLRPRARVCE